MSDASTATMIQRYMERAEAPMFLTSYSQTPPRNFHRTQFVELDIQRDDEDIAIAVHDVTVEGRLNEANQYTNKRFAPPVFKEKGAITAWEQYARQPGANPFDDPNFGLQATQQSFDLFGRLERKIRRSIELMWSQIFQTGVVTLTDSNGVALYSLDYQQKDSHRANASVTWAADGSAGVPLTDIESLADTVRKHGHRQPDTLVFGSTALQRFFANTQVRNQLDNRRMDRGMVQTPSRPREGAKYHGTIAVGNRLFEIWLYDGFYRDPTTQQPTDYVGANNVIMLSSSGRLDTTYGAVPYFAAERRAMQFLPTQFESPEAGLSITANSFISQDNSALFVEASSRPLAIPTAIDTFGVLSITAA